MKVLFFVTLVIGLVMPCTLWAKNLALELDGETVIEIPNSDSLNPKSAITIEAWMNMSRPVGECLAKDWGNQRDYIFPEIVQNGNGLRFVLWPGPKILDVPGLKPKEWQHLAGVWDGEEMRTYIDGKDGFGKPNYVDVTKDLNLEPLSVDPEDKLTTTWAWVKRTR